MLNVASFIKGDWVPADDGARLIRHAITGSDFATAGNDRLDFGGMIEFARTKGGTALRSMTFHQRANMLKALAHYLNEHKQQL